MPVKIRQIPCLADNYGYLIRDEASGAVASIDTPDPEAINAALDQEGWRLTHILNTHHHWDHAGGNMSLKEKWNCEIIGPRNESEKIPGIDRLVGEGDNIMLGDSCAQVFDTPGHTNGHIVYHFADDGVAFVGDTIFALGCGRLFEGTPKQMWSSLEKIASWPDETKLYCAHEYTQANARFALSIEPDNKVLKNRSVEIDRLRDNNQPTVPMTVGEERESSPFLRSADPALKTALGMQSADPVTVFAEVRSRKDKF